MHIDTSLPMNFSNDGCDTRHIIALTPDDRVPSRNELDTKYGPGNWVIEYRGFASKFSNNRVTNPENPRRRVW